MKNTRFEAGSADNIIRYRVKEPIVCGETYKREIVLSQRRGDVKCISFIQFVRKHDDCAWIGGDWCEQERKQVEIPKKAKYNKNTEKQRREVFE